jgi:hypothetical protein
MARTTRHIVHPLRSKCRAAADPLAAGRTRAGRDLAAGHGHTGQPPSPDRNACLSILPMPVMGNSAATVQRFGTL